MKTRLLISLVLPLTVIFLLLAALRGYALFTISSQAPLSMAIEETVFTAIPNHSITAQLIVTANSTATAQFSLDGVPAGWSVPIPADIVLQPGVTQTVNLLITPGAVGTAVFTLTAQLTGQPETAVSHPITVRVVKEPLTLTEVQLTPDFVETGSGSSRIRLHLLNHTGLPLVTTATVRLLDSAAQVVQTLSMSLPIAPRPETVVIGNLNLNGLTTGTYTAVVTLANANGLLAENFAPLTVGQELRFSHSPRTQIIPPGEVTRITTTITSTRAVLTETVSFTPTVKWTANFTQEPAYDQVAMMPAVGDVTGDSIPDIVFSSYAGQNYVNNGILRIYRGDTGAQITSVITAALRVNPLSSPLLVDLEGDGAAEIVIMLSDGGLAAFSGSGQLKYSSVPTFTLAPQQGMMPAAADLNQDGLPEIVVGRFVLNNTLSQLTILGASSGDETQLVGGIIADTNLDGVPEVLANNTIYAAGGGILYQNTAVPSPSSIGVGNFDTDPYPEIVVVDPLHNGRLYLLDHEMNLLWGPVTIPTSGVPQYGNGGPPTIADFDGDGEPEIGVAGDKRYVVFEGDGSILWQQPTQDLSSGFTGASVFDFQGDGRAEVVYADETALRVYDGPDGSVLFTTPHSSITGYELPVIADVDGDGAAEIVLVDNDAFLGSFSGLRVFEADDDSWVATRQVWHQHAYDITSVDDDLQIVSQPTPVWLLHNTFRSQAPSPTQGGTYFVELRHQLAPTGTLLLTDTLSPLPLSYDHTHIHWLYAQQERVALKLGQLGQLVTPPLGPGAARALSLGTAITNTIGGQSSYLTLPPFFAVTPHVVNLTPKETAVLTNTTTQYTIHLHNPFTTPQIFTLTLYGLPADWVSFDPVVTLAVGELAERPLTITVPAEAAYATYTLLLEVETNSGVDAISAQLHVVAQLPLTALYLPVIVSANTPSTCALIPYTPANLPGIDLVITDLRVASEQVSAGETTAVQLTIKNQGQQNVPYGNNFFADFYVNPPAEPPQPLQQGTLYWPVQGGLLPSGASLTLTGSYIFPTAGVYRLWAQVDTDNHVPASGSEADEGNNAYGCYALIVH
ncbi:MAG: FG-GAP-like repeat-containing protein [Chloroflexota bacterium]